MGRPISGNHAIEAVVFAVVFERPFSQSSVESLLTLEQSLAKKYPLFSPIKVVKMRTDNSGSKMTEFQAGVSLKQLKEEKKPAWSLRVDANNIIITCFEYTRWEEISPQAIDDLVHVINVGADDQNPVHHLTLQTVDRFIEDPEEKYSINLVFNPESRYLTRQAVEAGTLWHVHQGWFQDTGIADGRQLNILNLSTNVTATGITTTIDHNAQFHFTLGQSVTNFANPEYIFSIFNTLHESNKAVVTDLLNEKQCKDIGLC